MGVPKCDRLASGILLGRCFVCYLLACLTSSNMHCVSHLVTHLRKQFHELPSCDRNGILILLLPPDISLGFTILGEIFAYVTFFFFFFLNPTIEVVTSCLHGWCMLGVFLLSAFTHLGHKCHDLDFVRWKCMCAQTLTSVCTLMLKSPREKSPLPEKFSSEEDRTHDAAASRTASPRHYQ